MKHAVGLDLADGFLSFVESDVVHIKNCIVSDRVGDVRGERTLFADEICLTAVVYMTTGEEEVDHGEFCSVSNLRTDVV